LLTDHDLLLEISGQNSEIAREFSVEKNLNEILKVIGENIH
jgi:UDP-glucose:(heptosyl)LPS alpha-1,3-glucosyltransferase